MPINYHKCQINLINYYISTLIFKQLNQKGFRLFNCKYTKKRKKGIHVTKTDKMSVPGILDWLLMVQTMRKL